MRSRPTAGVASSGWLVVSCVLAFIGHRALVLGLGFDGTFFWEETYRLLVAEALLHGWPIALSDLQADPYTGGSLVIGVLAMPVVLLDGPSIVGLKCVALAWSAIGLACWMALVDRHFGRRAAVGFAVCFIFAPPLFQVYNLVAMGSHAEAVTLSGVQCLLAYRYLYAGKRSAASLAVWGLVAGFGAWFTYTSLPAFVVCAAFAVIAGALPPRRWPALAVGFLLGASPWIIGNVASGGAGLAVLGATFGSAMPGQTGFVSKLAALLSCGLPAALEYHDVHRSLAGLEIHVSRYALSYPYYLALVAAWCVGVWHLAVVRRQRAASLRSIAATRPELPMLALVALFVVLIAASNQVFDERIARLGRVSFLPYRVLVPAMPAMFVALALALARLHRTGRRLALAGVVALGLVASGRIVAWGTDGLTGAQAVVRETGAEVLGHLLYYKHGPAMARLRAPLAAVPPDLRAASYRGLGFSLAYHHPAEASETTLVELIAGIDPRYRGAVIEGARAALGPGLPQVNPRPVSQHTRAMLHALDALDAPGSPH